MLKDIRTNPFYRPLWRRVLIVATTVIWFALEFWRGDGIWTPIAGALCGFSVWAFLVTYPKPPAQD